ncbi:MAG: hypothetical protein A3C55_01655 [Gammaproteobacteria bacterium RIFCSPHIGHO2_02_FULL_42_13]|nr:MAG: hypothetical protein A3C55_01655 [Gammaproteobacteria bacterium RIFCSPHIGHO2_02_FULL_42_13]OGT70871.1 MAG: hypothetical protein A3H43_00965 [Gammaproteobacteria bacterium RIFCSPLOWO2_02_FULL_42_9]
MKTTVKDLIGEYGVITAILQRHGFNSATLFKGFGDEEKNLNLLVRDSFTEDSEPSSQMIRLHKVAIELAGVLPCTIVVTEAEKMDRYYMSKLDEMNSVQLLEPHLEEERVFAQLTKRFGVNWEFNVKQETEEVQLELAGEAFLSAASDCDVDEVRRSVSTLLRALGIVEVPEDFLAQIVPPNRTLVPLP